MQSALGLLRWLVGAASKGVAQAVEREEQLQREGLEGRVVQGQATQQHQHQHQGFNIPGTPASVLDGLQCQAEFQYELCTWGKCLAEMVGITTTVTGMLPGEALALPCA